MVQSLKLASPASQGDPGIQRLNRLPIFAVIGLAILVGLLFVMFQAVFTWATPAMDGIEAALTVRSRSTG